MKILDSVRNNPKLKEFKTKHPNANAVVIIIAIVMLWRGVWGLLDVYLFPGNPVFSSLFSIALGALVLYIDDFSIDNLKR